MLATIKFSWVLATRLYRPRIKANEINTSDGALLNAKEIPAIFKFAILKIQSITKAVNGLWKRK